MYRRRSLKPMIITMSAFMIVALIGIVYAVFTGQLTITGTAVNRSSSWDVHFENLSNITTTHTAKVLSQPSLASSTSIADYSVSTTTPGDSISFTFKVVNGGNYNAKITGVTIGSPSCSGTDTTSNSNVCSHLHYTLTYDSGASVAVNDIIPAKDHKTMKVTLTYDDTVTASQLATSDVSISNLGIVINFEQSGDALVKDNGEVANYRVYHQGDKITLNNEDYYVIADSGASQDYVVALKDEPLTVAEVNLYGGAGTENNHVNRYKQSSAGTARNQNGYGGVAYYSSETCGYVNNSWVITGCTTAYEQSEVKYIVEAWSLDKFQNNELKEVDNYSARLIIKSEYEGISNTYSWRYNSKYYYWTMTPSNSSTNVWSVHTNGSVFSSNGDFGDVIRPVINVYKSVLETNSNEQEQS